MRVFNLIIVAFALVILHSCMQGRPSDKPPIHINPNMDKQEKYKPQEASNYFADGSVNRMPVEGTVAVTELFEDTQFFFGKDEQGKFIGKSPLGYSMDVLERGKERYNIYCSPCHSLAGDGKGIVVQRGFMPPPTFHQDRLRNMPDGQIFDIISNGFRNMPSYKHQIPVDDRWKIVAYVRALQKTQNAAKEDVPQEKRNQIN